MTNLLIDGCDCVGKTSLIKEFLKLRPEYEIIKCSAPKDKLSAKKLYQNLAKRLNKNDNIILDRGMLSEKVYAPIFRKYYPEYMDELEESLKNTLLVLVTCSPHETLKRFDGEFIKPEDIPKILDLFENEYDCSNYKKKMIIDTTYLTSKECAKKLNNKIGIKDKFVKCFSNIAIEASKLSTCQDKQVGAVLIKDKRIIAIGYNGVPSKQQHCENITFKSNDKHTEWSLNNEIHAEQNLISFCAKNGIKTKDTTMFLTLSPCINCAKIIIAAGIKNIYYLNKWKHGQEVINYLKKNKINIIKIEKQGGENEKKI